LLADRLPDYMLPAAFVPIEALPLTASGKVDRNALPPPQSHDAADAGRAILAPRTPDEARLATIWSELLGVSNVGAMDSFFALGGHSLLVMQLVSRVRDAFGVELPLRALFDTPDAATVARLAEHIEAIRWAARGAHVVAVAEDDREQGDI
jgi:acyl carrier protein